MSVSKDLVDVIKASNKKETKPYDTQATVTRVEGSTVWVHIPGGIDETPVKRTISAKEGDVVQVRVSGGSAWLMGNASNPPTDDTAALLATEYARSASMAAESAVQSAKTAGDAAAEAVETANSVRGLAEEAKKHADEAETAAQNASEYAARSLANLSTVQSVAETLNWITEHGTMTLTSDTELNPTHVYFVEDAGGDYVVAGTHYRVVTEPDASHISTYYELSIDESLNNYVGTHLAVTSEGLWILPEGMSTSSYRILIATGGRDHTYKDAGTYIIDSGGETVAKLGEIITLGVNDNTQSYLKFDYHSMKMYDKENDVYLHISDLRAKDGYAIVSEDFVYDDDYSKVFTVSCSISDVYAVYINDTMISDSDYTVNAAAWSVTITRAIFHGDKVTVEYDTESTFAKAFTFGTRGSNKVPSPLSASFGAGNISGGMASFAEGIATKAIGRYSHSEGYDTTASRDGSHSEGVHSTASGEVSHAEGSHTTASGDYSHAEGNHATASGMDSHAQNTDTIAQRLSQTAIGRYNEADTNGRDNDSYGKYALIIGNGTSDDDRSNALAVGWDGIPYHRNPNGDFASVFDLIYPIGSIYMSVNNVSPDVLFGGTWEQIQDRFLLSAGSSYSAGSTGGSADASLPAHTHSVSGTAASGGAHTHSVSGTAASNGAHTHSMNKLWSNGSGKETAYTMQSNRVLTTRNTASAGAHTHTVSGTAASNGAHTHSVSGTAASQGVDATGKNMPPYMAVYMWKRTA